MSVADRQRLAEVLVNELDGDGAFADGRSDALDRAVADIAGREHPGQAGLQQQRWPIERPVAGWPAVAEEVRPVSRNPRSSRWTVAASQSVWGSAPIMMNSAAAANLSVASAALSLMVSVSSRPAPCTSVTSVRSRTVMLPARCSSCSR